MLDGALQGALAENTPVALGVRPIRGRCEVLPKERVVDMTTAIETKRGLQGDALFRGSRLGIVVLGSIERIDIGLMMLVVMEAHDLCDDVRLERIIAVREIGKGVCARHDDGGERKKNTASFSECDRRAQHDMLGGFDTPFHGISHIALIGGPAGRIAECISHTLSSHARRRSPIRWCRPLCHCLSTLPS